MTPPLRLSPIHDRLQALPGTWRTIHGMPSLVSRSTDAAWAARMGIADRSPLPRLGVKGAKAGDWLSQQGLPIPHRPNSWHPLPEGGIVARLGLTEFLVEDGLNGTIVPPLVIASENPPSRVYPVLRQDLALGLVGDRVHDLLRQTCSFNFQALDLDDRPVVLTSMVGVAVTVLPGVHRGQPWYRLWCDGTFGTYFWQTLVQIGTELGGGAIGTEFIP